MKVHHLQFEALIALAGSTDRWSSRITFALLLGGNSCRTFDRVGAFFIRLPFLKKCVFAQKADL